MTKSSIKINWFKDTYCTEDGIRKFEDTGLVLNGIYEDEDGDIHYLKNGKYHNENGPAYIEKDGYKEYCINGKCHKIDGPAVIYPGGAYDWWINDCEIDKETMTKWLTENDIPLDWDTWSTSDKTLFALHWSDYEG